MTTIHSTLLKEDPDMLELVNKFLSRLPTFIEAIANAHNNNDQEELQSELHKLKGIAGGFGYSGLTDLAAAGEQLCKQNKIEEIPGLLNQLIEMSNNVAP